MDVHDNPELLKFFFEEHLSGDATAELRRRGIDVLRSIETGFPRDEPDESLLEYATRESRIMVRP